MSSKEFLYIKRMSQHMYAFDKKNTNQLKIGKQRK